jgi:hypothetical protein
MSTNRSKDRFSLCSFTFADGRQCRTPGPRIRTSACSTVSCSGGSSDPLARRPRARRFFRGQPRDPLFAVVVQILPLAQDEYINAYDTDT